MAASRSYLQGTIGGVRPRDDGKGQGLMGRGALERQPLVRDVHAGVSGQRQQQQAAQVDRAREHVVEQQPQPLEHRVPHGALHAHRHARRAARALEHHPLLAKREARLGGREEGLEGGERRVV